MISASSGEPHSLPHPSTYDAVEERSVEADQPSYPTSCLKFLDGDDPARAEGQTHLGAVGVDAVDLQARTACLGKRT